MADMILKRDVQTGIEMAWHNKTIVRDVITKENCGILYPMEKQELALPNGTKTGFHCIVSLDDGLPIGNPVGEGYKLIDNSQVFEAVENALGGTDHKIVSIGTVCNRSIVFIGIELNKKILTANGQFDPFLNVIFGHGGVKDFTAKSDITKPVCKNTVDASLAYNSKDFKLSFKHSKNAEIKLLNMAQAIDRHYGVCCEFENAMNEMASLSLSQNKAESVFAGFVSRGDDKEKLTTRSKNTVNRLVELFNNGLGNRGQTMADGFNAITDYYTHESSGGEDTWKQFESSEFGSGNRKKSEAFNLFRGLEVNGLGDFETVVKRGESLLLAS